MIKIEKIATYGWEAAIRGMRNPMLSHGKSDSKYCDMYGESHFENGGCCCENAPEAFVCPSELTGGYSIGENDLSLMKKLVKAGNDHSKFMRMIGVTMDVTAPLYFWKEASTYKVGTVENSCSTMHKIHAKEFELSDFSFEKLEDLNLYNQHSMLLMIIEHLNWLRAMYNETKDKKYWYGMVQFLPSSYNQKRTWSMNYAVLRNIYHARKDHKLDEWKEFCKIIKCLPYSELITGEEK